MNDLEEEVSFDDKVSTYSDFVLCDLIVVSRYLNFNQEAAILSMKELSKRRAEGSDFDFESVIEEKAKELPDISNTTIDLKSMFSTII